MFMWHHDAVVICSICRFSFLHLHLFKRRMQNKPSHGLLGVGVDRNKKNNYNYLFRDNVMLPELNNCKRTKSSQLLLQESLVFTDSWLGGSLAQLCKKYWTDFNKITARKWRTCKTGG